MLRMAFRMGADLETAFRQANNQLEGYLADDRFITAFIGLLDPAAHKLRFHSGGQAPILLFDAGARECRRYKPTSFPLAAMPLKALRPALEIDLAPGDILVLLSDGIYEYRNAGGEEFGEVRVETLLARHNDLPASELAAKILGAVQAFAGNAMQEDDMTVVLVKRRAAA
jgi:phosphoserine phosphatase RsbU/P